ncbi:MAG: hypothetical protein RML33_00295 [Acidobacteriota bacterium]|nr:hypothetical protein [Acidobacteriota bacterium]
MRNHTESGSATAKFVIVVLIVILAVYAGWNYVAVLYQSAQIRQEMHTAVLQGSALPPNSNKGDPISITKERIRRAVQDYELPPDTYIEVKWSNQNLLQARVYYKRKINFLPFGLWEREYVFDETVTPTGFLTKQ